MNRAVEVGAWLERDLARTVDEHDIPGASLAVLVDGQVVQRSAGVVNRRTGVPVTADTLFPIQSITKVWTATLVMQLVDEGLVALDAPVRTYLPAFRTADETVSAGITVRQLLSHTGGFEGDLWAPTTNDENALRYFVEQLVAEAAQFAPPGRFYSYCSSGYGVLGRLVEVLRGMAYPQALRRYLGKPLGLGELAFDADEALAFRTAIGHGRPGPGSEQQPLRTWSQMPPSNPAAGNQLAMSARSLIAFARMHLAGGLAADGTQVLSASGVTAMRDRQVDHPGIAGSTDGHGLGWVVSNRSGLIEHGGGSVGVEALLQLAPERNVAIALLTNCNGAVGPISIELLNPLLTELAGIPAPATLPSPPPPPHREVLERYTGRYEHRVERSEVSIDDSGRLWLSVSEQNEGLDLWARAGLSSNGKRYELRLLDVETVLLLDSAGTATRVARFEDFDADGRPRYLRTGRVARRTVS